MTETKPESPLVNVEGFAKSHQSRHPGSRLSPGQGRRGPEVLVVPGFPRIKYGAD